MTIFEKYQMADRKDDLLRSTFSASNLGPRDADCLARLLEQCQQLIKLNGPVPGLTCIHSYVSNYAIRRWCDASRGGTATPAPFDGFLFEEPNGFNTVRGWPSLPEMVDEVLMLHPLGFFKTQQLHVSGVLAVGCYKVDEHFRQLQRKAQIKALLKHYSIPLDRAEHWSRALRHCPFCRGRMYFGFDADHYFYQCCPFCSRVLKKLSLSHELAYADLRKKEILHGISAATEQLKTEQIT